MSEVVKSRPRYGVMRLIDATGYRLPLAGFVSILHRISGMLMFLLLPFILFMLDKSLTSEVSFAELKALTSGVFVKLVILALVWAYLHHFSAGVRHLFMDLHYGLDKHTARKSAVGVLAVSLTLTALIGLKLFGVF
ncbi:succinate dehydrogenase, cytochrome b556 subunit [Undibacterium oligocarboniphilum]|uniref:Succinate dehydrogenase cytochrome b556 subunit n=1 Tax=Undibacterium oligocarboniphilum TaxID=666702 RepID=A0A850QD20_9BURK|nr:succinate dehydrogenase, cytochrome b556 subunit [Undibacterium oligocarboniphilum]MBC3868776.1 succinate dehydrogenase, cytochrome b556 subunit [Undibacterium oligocarboniphilum]NVO76757.1 succinate dehydrogenase, cytochrome b556 subunit [Undibacterium oligocarboniphilum]